MHFFWHVIRMRRELIMRRISGSSVVKNLGQKNFVLEWNTKFFRNRIKPLTLYGNYTCISVVAWIPCPNSRSQCSPTITTSGSRSRTRPAAKKMTRRRRSRAGRLGNFAAVWRTSSTRLVSRPGKTTKCEFSFQYWEKVIKRSKNRWSNHLGRFLSTG